jgi:hypothetical protein
MAHNSTLKKGEPSWGSVDKTKLPRSAFADQGDSEKKSTWKYPHHWVSGGTMYLHRGGLAAAWAAAQGARSGKQASSAIKAHLQRHRKAIGMGDEKKQSQSMPVDINALHIMDQGTPEFELSESSDGVRKFRMVGYSGKVIRGHWWWGNLAIDLSGGTFSKPKFPILRDHLSNMELGFSKKPKISNEEGLVFTEKEVTFLENEDVDKFVENSKKGFPYQASIAALPTVIERVEEGESVKVNGHTLKGPGTVWRKWNFKECSICVFGYDEQTTAQVFSSSGHTVDIEVENIGLDHNQITDKLEVFSMDLDKLKEDSPEEYERLMAEAVEATKAATADAIATAVAEAVSGFQAQVVEKDNQIAALTTEKTTLSESFTKIEGRCLSLEKKDALRDESDLKSQEESIWLTALATSGLPAWQHQKVRNQVSRDKFMDGDTFDKAAFTEAVVAEITDWEAKNGQEVEGFGVTLRDADGTSTANEQMKSDAIVDRMLGYVGQASKEKH